MENTKKRKWTFYLLLFAIYAVVNFVVSLLRLVATEEPETINTDRQ